MLKFSKFGQMSGDEWVMGCCSAINLPIDVYSYIDVNKIVEKFYLKLDFNNDNMTDPTGNRC